LSILPFDGIEPELHPDVFVAGNAIVIGRVKIDRNASIWFGSVVRADSNDVHIGKNTNLQDCVVVHTSAEFPCRIGEGVVAGHNAVIHACTIGDNCLIGIGSIVLNGADIGEGSIVAAGSVVTPGKKFPPRAFIMGIPGRHVRDVTDEEYNTTKTLAGKYVNLAQQYKSSTG